MEPKRSRTELEALWLEASEECQDLQDCWDRFVHGH